MFTVHPIENVKPKPFLISDQEEGNDFAEYLNGVVSDMFDQLRFGKGAAFCSVVITGFLDIAQMQGAGLVLDYCVECKDGYNAVAVLLWCDEYFLYTGRLTCCEGEYLFAPTGLVPNVDRFDLSAALHELTAPWRSW